MGVGALKPSMKLLILMACCWLFAIGTFANIFRTGRTDILNKRGKEFFDHFPGLLIATATIMVCSTYLASNAIAQSVVHVLSRAGMI
jgi:hypothetical protein